MSKYATVEERFWSHVDRGGGDTRCWNWTGPRHRADAVFCVGKKCHSAHRYAYELLVMPLSPAFQLARQCGNRLCVNPAHMLSDQPEMRFWAKVNQNGPDGCWLWTSTTNVEGYGQFVVGGRPKRRMPAHRFAYELLVGPIPDDRPELDHLCRVRNCVNPGHLEPVTRWENLRRAPNSSVWRHLNEPLCERGHDPSRMRHGRTKAGYRTRRCLECHRLLERARKEQRQAEGVQR